MFLLEPPLLLWATTAIQILGLASIVLARVGEGCRGQARCQRLFIGCLALVGVTTMVTLGLHSGCWPFCGATLSMMVLGATLDFGRPRRVGV